MKFNVVLIGPTEIPPFRQPYQSPNDPYFNIHVVVYSIDNNVTIMSKVNSLSLPYSDDRIEWFVLQSADNNQDTPFYVLASKLSLKVFLRNVYFAYLAASVSRT